MITDFFEMVKPGRKFVSLLSGADHLEGENRRIRMIMQHDNGFNSDSYIHIQAYRKHGFIKEKTIKTGPMDCFLKFAA